MSNLLISVSGIRGVVGESFTADVALRYSGAFASYLKTGSVAIGGDTRRTGPMIKAACIAGLLGGGRDVVDIGVCPTPTVELAVKEGGFAGGIAVTASHNPDQYNALKLIGPDGLFLSEKQGNRVKEIYEKNLMKNVDWAHVGSLTADTSWVDIHIQRILGLDIISPDQIKSAGLKAVIDCGGGAAIAMAEKFFSALGIEFELIHSERSGMFPRGPEPVPENLNDLCAAVKKADADIGLAFDPDADRLALVSDLAEPLGEEYTLALGARYILSQERGPMAVNLSSSLMNEFVAGEAGVKLYRTKVGERNVTERLKKSICIVGGEGNGGLIYPKLHYGRDAFMAAAVILQYLAVSRKKISRLAVELPGYVMLKRKIGVTRRMVESKIRVLEKKFPGGRIDKADGIRISGDGWWVQIRASNTEPIARIMSEASDIAKAESLISAAGSVFKKK